MNLRRIFAATALVGLAAAAAAQESFRVSDIRLQGLQRVSSGTVFNLLPVNVGDDIDGFTLGQLTRALFESGYFRRHSDAARRRRARGQVSGAPGHRVDRA